jgi:hypothetical protein
MSMKNSSDTIGNRNRDLPACSTVPQPTAPPRTPVASGNATNKDTKLITLMILLFQGWSDGLSCKQTACYLIIWKFPKRHRPTTLVCRKAAYPVSRSVSRNVFVKNWSDSLCNLFSFRNHKQGAYQLTMLIVRHLAPTSRPQDRVLSNLERTLRSCSTFCNISNTWNTCERLR